MIEGPEASPEAAPELAPLGKVARARAGVAHAQTRGQDALHRLEAKRPESKLVDASFHFYERDLGAGGGVLAGALAFRMFIYVVPYSFVLLTLFGSAADLTWSRARTRPAPPG